MANQILWTVGVGFGAVKSISLPDLLTAPSLFRAAISVECLSKSRIILIPRDLFIMIALLHGIFVLGAFGHGKIEMYLLDRLFDVASLAWCIRQDVKFLLFFLSFFHYHMLQGCFSRV